MSGVRLLIAVAVLSAACMSSCWALGVGEPAPPFKLTDQFGKTWDLGALKSSVVIVVAADRDSGRAMGPWFDDLKAKYGSKARLLGLMQLKGIPGFARGIARSRIKKETQDPLMIDFEGTTGNAYGVSSKYPVVVVIDKTGVVRAVEKTNYDPAAAKSISDAIDAALK